MKIPTLKNQLAMYPGVTEFIDDSGLEWKLDSDMIKSQDASLLDRVQIQVKSWCFTNKLGIPGLRPKPVSRFIKRWIVTAPGCGEYLFNDRDEANKYAISRGWLTSGRCYELTGNYSDGMDTEVYKCSSRHDVESNLKLLLDGSYECKECSQIVELPETQVNTKTEVLHTYDPFNEIIGKTVWVYNRYLFADAVMAKLGEK